MYVCRWIGQVRFTHVKDFHILQSHEVQHQTHVCMYVGQVNKQNMVCMYIGVQVRLTCLVVLYSSSLSVHRCLPYIHYGMGLGQHDSIYVYRGTSMYDRHEYMNVFEQRDRYGRKKDQTHVCMQVRLTRTTWWYVCIQVCRVGQHGQQCQIFCPSLCVHTYIIVGGQVSTVVSYVYRSTSMCDSSTCMYTGEQMDRQGRKKVGQMR